MILVTGATGFLGRRVCRLLDVHKLRYSKTSISLGLDLRDKSSAIDFFEKIRPSYVLNCAAFVGGIQFGLKYPAELFSNNLQMTLNLLEACKITKVKRIVNPISNCSYPGHAEYFKEESYWDGPLHESVMVYGFARKASWMGGWAYAKQYGLDSLNLIFSNMYGPEDHFEEERSHALGALIMKFSEAKKKGLHEVVVWGSGKPIREWLHVDDAAEAMIRAINVKKTLEIINVGVGKGISIFDMAHLIKDCVGYHGRVVFDRSKPDGALCKTMDGSHGAAVLGWEPAVDFKQGVKETIQWYLDQSISSNHSGG